MSNNGNRFTDFNTTAEPTVTRSWVGSDAQGYARDGYDTIDALSGAEDALGGTLTVLDDDGGEQWPYLWAFTRTTAPLSLFEYAEGDLTEWRYADTAERDAAREAYAETDAAYAQRLAEDAGHNDGGMGDAILDWIKERGLDDGATAENIADALENYRGEFDNDAEYVEETAENFGVPTTNDGWQDADGNPLPEWLSIRIDWEDVALWWRNTPGMVFTSYSGHYFTTGD